MSERVKVSEHAHQVTLVQWFDRTHGNHRGRLFAIPNGGYRAKATAVKLNAEGVRRGVPDLFLPIPNGAHAGLFIELKSETGRPTKEQREWVEYLNEAGYHAAFCYGFDEAKALIEEYMRTVPQF